jgi:hypothetical protein
VREAPERLLERPHHVEVPHNKRPCDGDCLKFLCREMSLSSVELAPRAIAHDVLGVRHRCYQVEPLSKSLPDKCPWASVMPTRVFLDLA